MLVLIGGLVLILLKGKGNTNPEPNQGVDPEQLVSPYGIYGNEESLKSFLSKYASSALSVALAFFSNILT